MTNLRTALPELNDNQMKLLYRLISDEVIGHSGMARFGGSLESLIEEVRFNAKDRLRAEQRQALAELMGVDK